MYTAETSLGEKTNQTMYTISGFADQMIRFKVSNNDDEIKSTK